MHPALLAALAALPLLAHAGMYRDPVVELDARSFKKVMANEHASMVAFVAPWCGHCQNMVPEYTSAAKSLSPLIPFYTVDCDADANKPLCAEYGIKGFPTVKAFPRASKGPARDYQGERRRGALVEYAKNLVPDRVKKLRADDGVEVVVDRFLDEKPKLPHALLVHPKAPSIPFLWKVLGHRLSGKAMLGFIKDANHGVLTSLGLEAGDDGARLLFWEKGAERPSVIEYTGELKFNALLEWLEAAIKGEVQEPREREPREEGEPKAESQSTQAAAAAESSADAAAKRAKLQAKLDEAERRDRLRREKLAAQREAEDEAHGGTPVEEPAAEPADVVGEEVLGSESQRESLHAGREREDYGSDEEGTPVDAPAPEPADEDDEWSAFAEETRADARDEL